MTDTQKTDIAPTTKQEPSKIRAASLWKWKKKVVKKKEKEKKEGTRKPTERQKKAAQILAGNGGSAADALRKAWYSPEIVNNPQRVTESKGFQEVFSKYVPDELLADTNKQIIRAKKSWEKRFPFDLEDSQIIEICKGMDIEVIHIHPVAENGKMVKLAYIKWADLSMRSRGLELGYKARWVGKDDNETGATLDLVGFFQGAMRLRVGGKPPSSPGNMSQ